MIPDGVIHRLAVSPPSTQSKAEQSLEITQQIAEFLRSGKTITAEPIQPRPLVKQTPKVKSLETWRCRTARGSRDNPPE